jgi:hypothetical protein
MGVSPERSNEEFVSFNDRFQSNCLSQLSQPISMQPSVSNDQMSQLTLLLSQLNTNMMNSQAPSMNDQKQVNIAKANIGQTQMSTQADTKITKVSTTTNRGKPADDALKKKIENSQKQVEITKSKLRSFQNFHITLTNLWNRRSK